MKIKMLYFYLIATSLLFVFNMQALSANKADIVGKITDKITGEPLPFANIQIVGTSIGTAADLDGNYVLKNVEEGEHTLKISFMGYQSKEVQIKIDNKGNKLILNVSLDYQILESGEVVLVTAQAKRQLDAINNQLSSNSIINAISADRIQELPDANAAESVGRLPGVSLQREGGEGNKVVIRGLSPKYNAVTVNGVRLASTDVDDRSTDLSMISQYMLSGIEVIKAGTPDQDGDVIGGTVNFKIKEAKEGLSWNLMTQGSYNGLEDTYNDYKIVAGASNRFFDNRLGALVQFDIERKNRGSHELEASYWLNGPSLEKENDPLLENLSVRSILRDINRYSGSLVLDYKLNNGKIALSNLFSKVDKDVTSYSNIYNLIGNSHDYNTRSSEIKTSVISNSLKYEQDLEIFRVDAFISHSYSENDVPIDFDFQFGQPSAFVNTDEYVHPSLLPGYAKEGISDAYLSSRHRRNSFTKEREFTSGANFEVDLNISDQVSSVIKFGGKYRYKDRSYDINVNWNHFDTGSGTDYKNLVLETFPRLQEYSALGSTFLYYPGFVDQGYSVDDFLGGDYAMGPVADVGLLKDITDLLVSSVHNEIDVTESNFHDYSGNESYKAGYLMVNMDIGTKLSVVGGVRYENNVTEYTAFRGDVASFSTYSYNGVKTTTRRDNSFWLPSLQIHYKPISGIGVRFAYSNTLTRPNYSQILPFWHRGHEGVNWSNYKLKPGRSTNYDLYLSIHENHVGLFTIGGFYKEIKDLIFNVGNRVILDTAYYGLPADDYKKMVYDVNMNNPLPAELWGIELDWQTSFWYLPGVLKGLVMNVNYTHIFSEVEYPRTEIRTEYIFEPTFQIVQENVESNYVDRLIDQPNDIVNLSIGYDYLGFSARISMLYKTDVFQQTDFWEEQRETTDDYLRWDISLKQDMPIDGMQLFLNLNNLTNAVDRGINYGNSFPTKEQFYRRTIDLGIRIHY